MYNKYFIALEKGNNQKIIFVIFAPKLSCGHLLELLCLGNSNEYNQDMQCKSYSHFFSNNINVFAIF